MHTRGKETPGPLNDDITTDDLPNTEEEKEEVKKLPIRQLIGGLWWVAQVSRPDIYCALHKCAKWQNKPSRKLWTHIQWILKYLKHTVNYKIVYDRKQKDEGEMYIAQADASFASEPKARSRYGYIINFCGALVCWASQTVERVVTSSTEAECAALVAVVKDGMWVRSFVKDLQIFRCASRMVVYQDNKSAIALTQKGGSHKRSKHFSVEFELLRQCIKQKEIDVRYRSTHELVADMFTKLLTRSVFERHRSSILEEDISGGRKEEDVRGQVEVQGERWYKRQDEERRRGEERQGEARQGEARQGEARQGEARQDEAQQDETRQGEKQQ